MLPAACPHESRAGSLRLARTVDSATPVAGLGFTYAAAGAISLGDVRVIDLDIDAGTGVSRVATPTSGGDAAAARHS